jgi:16S rRNA (cytosine1402-N4)-methyltransferase
MEYSHNSVMPEEIIENLKPKSGGVYVDATLGGAGHSRLILENSVPDGKLVCIDQDIEAIENGKKTLLEFGDRVFFHRGNFSSINLFVKESCFSDVDGIVADLGVSSHHLDTDSRGFSFAKEGPLDMRMDRAENSLPLKLSMNIQVKIFL